MIHPRPTQHIQATQFGFHVFKSVDQNRDRQTRHCPCGTKLRRTKPAWEMLCDACDTKRLLETLPLVEDYLEVATSKHHPTRTCRCGRPMYRQSKTCRVCHLEARRSPA